MKMNNKFLAVFSVLLVFCFVNCCALAEVHIQVDPECTRSIQGISEFDRDVYFSLCDPGSKFDKRVKDESMYDYLINELNVRFGRRLGIVNGLVKWGDAVREDPQRPGYADITRLKEKLQKKSYTPGTAFKSDMGTNLGVAAHGQHNAYPEFMGKFTTPDTIKGDHAEFLPKNVDAAAELAATVLKYDYNDFDRPEFYEPVNEPHWGFYGTQHLADWHLKTMERVHKLTPEVKVGGLCLSVPYLYRDLYKVFRNYTKFIDKTQCKMDFYSFHVYDYVDFRDGDFFGRVSSGLPLESVLDIVPNYTVNTYGKEVAIVVSEHGGYVTGKQGKTGPEIAEMLGQKYFPGTGFDYDMKKRSILEHTHITSILTNTMVFMDHPHTVKKAVPFILLNAFGWDPEYYAVMYVPHEFKDKKRWIPTQQQNFYKFFKDLNGRRVKAICDDPDIQTRAFVDGNELYLVLNNLSDVDEAITVDLPKAENYSIKRLGRNSDFTPYLKEMPLDRLGPIKLQAREAVILTAKYKNTVKASKSVNEVPCYGNQVDVAVKDKAVFKVNVPDSGDIQYASLRIGVSRKAGSESEIQVLFNGKRLDIPAESCAPRLDDGARDYATCKIIQVPINLIKQSNSVEVSFKDDQPGSIGSVVLRAAYLQDNL